MLSLLLVVQLALVDSEYITTRARMAGLDQQQTHTLMAMIWEESQNELRPNLRGHLCWYTRPAREDELDTLGLSRHESLVERRDTVFLVHHEPDCEVGRAQIKPSTARRRCKGLTIWTHDGNVQCAVKMFAEDVAKYGVAKAVCVHNTGWPLKRCPYAERIAWTLLFK